MPTILGLIHTTALLIPAFNQLCRELLPPGTETFHFVDESLLKCTIHSGNLGKSTVRRLVHQVEAAQDAGANMVIVTCSSIGPGVTVARQLFDFPIVRIDERMAETAVSIGRRIGVLATLRSTLDPTMQLLRDIATTLRRPADVEPVLCEGAFEAATRGDTDAHDEMVLRKLKPLLQRADVVVLAQASMARATALLPEEQKQGVPILSSPRLAIEQVRDLLRNI